jgi:hypothetical protein
LTSTDFSTFKIKFTVDVTMPTDLIGSSIPVTAYIMDSANYQMVAKSSAVSILTVAKPTGQADTQATGLVSFGKDPNDSTEQGNGVGVYSTPYCIVPGSATGQFGDNYQSNCAVATAIDAIVAGNDNTKVLDLVNAIEINWALPYGIPNDRTQAEIICKTEQEAGGSDAATHFTNDPLRIHQSSMIAKGWGTGNCFYMGVAGDFQTPGQHKFQCRDIGALAKSANLQLAFQYSISNVGKTCTLGAEGTTTNNLVKTIAKKLECTLSIGTYSADKLSATNWYTAKFETKIDGDGQTSNFGAWSSFIGVKDGYASIGQDAANTDLEAGDTGVNAFVHIFLSFKDRVGARTTGMREFPFDTSVTDKELKFITYGVGLKADATLTVTIPAADKFITDHSLNAFTSSGVFGLANDPY